MSKRGRPPKPDSQKGDARVIKGEFGGDEKGAITLPEDAPDKPGWIGEDALASRCWDKLVLALHNIGTLQRCDEGLLASYCNCYARMVRAQIELNEHGEYYKSGGRDGVQFKAHPAIKVIEKCETTLNTLASQFGMSLSARRGLGIDPRQGSLPLGGELPGDPTKQFF